MNIMKHRYYNLFSLHTQKSNDNLKASTQSEAFLPLLITQKSISKQIIQIKGGYKSLFGSKISHILVENGAMVEATSKATLLSPMYKTFSFHPRNVL